MNKFISVINLPGHGKVNILTVFLLIYLFAYLSKLHYCFEVKQVRQGPSRTLLYLQIENFLQYILYSQTISHQGKEMCEFGDFLCKNCGRKHNLVCLFWINRAYSLRNHVKLLDDSILCWPWRSHLVTSGVTVKPCVSPETYKWCVCTSGHRVSFI